MAPQSLNVDPAYLQNILNHLQILEAQVNAIGTETLPGPMANTMIDVPPMAGLQVKAGGLADSNSGSSGSSSQGVFQPALALNGQLGKMGSSVDQEIGQWKKWLPDMITDLGNTIKNFGSVNDFNTQTVQQLENEFPDIFADMSSPGSTGSPG